MEHIDPVSLSRLQFAMTALYHFLFVPLTLGLSFLLAIMESVYVMTGREIWRDMTRFWGMLFGINFAMGVATGITMEFQFGTNWAYYSHYVGDIFGAPLAIEGLMAFFLEVDLHRPVLLRLGPAEQARPPHRDLAGGDRHQPVGAVDPDRQWLDAEPGRRACSTPTPCAWRSPSSATVMFNPVAQAKFVHTVSRRLRHRLDVRAGDQRLVPAQRPPPRLRQALDDRGRPPSASPRRCRWSCSATRAATRRRKTRR